ncbi:MAG: oxidoreductase, partial [Sciscionella sp.]
MRKGEDGGGAATHSENGIGGDGPELDVHDENPPAWAVMAADEIIRMVVEPDAGGMHRFRRRPTTPPVVQIADRYLTGLLDLRAQEFPYLLEFVRCRFERPPDIRQAKLAGCEFDRCWLPGLEARNLRSDNDIALRHSTVHGGRVDLTDADINGTLTLSGSTLYNPSGRALHGNRLVLAGALLATDMNVTGEIRIPGLRAGGNVNFRGAALDSPTGFALNANGIQVAGNLLCGTEPNSERRFTSNGALFLTNARIESDLVLRGAQLRQDNPPAALTPQEDPSFDMAATLVGDRLHVEGNVMLDQGLESTGTLRLMNGHIGGSLWLNRATVNVSGGHEFPFTRRALHFDGTRIDGDLEAWRSEMVGQLRLVDVTVRGSMLLDEAKLHSPSADVVHARRLTVGGNLDCRSGQIAGSFLLQGATIGANLDLRSSRLVEPGRYSRDGRAKPSLDARAITIGRDLTCAAGRDAFSAHGEIRMYRASVGRQANFAGAELGSDLADTALNAYGANIQDLLVRFGRAPRGRISLRHAYCAALTDSAAFWEATGGVDLEDFRYDALAEPVPLWDDKQVIRRLTWLRQAMSQQYSPGPYDQLAAMFRATGSDEHASTVLIRKQRHRYEALADGYRVLWPGVWLWSLVQRLMVGYGYRPTRALVWLLLLLVFGTLWFGLLPDDCALHHANNANLVVSDGRCALSSDDKEVVWNPFLYTLDLLVPIVDFGNKNRWHMAGADQWISATIIAMGWILASTVSAG